MLRVVDFKKLLRYVAVATTLLSLCIYEFVQGFWKHELPAIRILSIAPWIALIVTLAITTNLIARQVWKGLRKVDSSLFPDLNGTWEGEIVTENDLRIPAKGIIRQTLLLTQLDIHTATSKSLTLETTPTSESGQARLYYLYRSIPKNPNWSTYTGSTIFDVRNLGHALELSGYYFTDRKTNGRISLRQISKDTANDVSYY